MHAIPMYIRRTKTKTLSQNEAYYTYRIVESVRLGQKVKQRTLLNLGKDLSIDQIHWPLLCSRIEQLLQSSEAVQREIFDLADDLGQTLEATAQRYSALILQKHSIPVESTTGSAEQTTEGLVESDYHRVELIICKRLMHGVSGQKHWRYMRCNNFNSIKN